MNRWISIILGPESYWIAWFLVVRWIAARNVPPTAAGNTALNWAVWLAATLGVLLAFAVFSIPGVNKWPMLVRLAVAGFIGLNACAIAACGAIKYPELGRDSGLMALWFLAVGVGAIIWVAGAIVALLILRSRGKA